MIKAAKAAVKNFKIITFTGFKTHLIELRSKDLVYSTKYNIIENVHQFCLLLLVDMLKNKKDIEIIILIIFCS